MKKSKLISLVLGSVFFLTVVFTLPDYGINWDTINHLPRGQAYLNYYLSGNHDYSNLPKYVEYWQDPTTLAFKSDVEGVPRRSLYQNGGVTYDWFLEHDGGGHPPASDILSSFFNYVLFQRLGLINDIDSYRVYGVLLASVLVSLIFHWTYKNAGMIAGLVSALALSTYPLFFSETHFNTEKDIPETVYWSLLLYSVFKGINEKSSKWILASGVFFGLALGSKFNVLFIVFVIVPWLIIHLFRENGGLRKPDFKKIVGDNKRLLVAISIAPVFGLVIFIFLWPYLWGDIIGNLTGVIKFYKTIGTTTNVDPRFLGLFGMNTYPITWIMYTTPVVVLVLSVFGVLYSTKQLKSDKNDFYLMMLLWLIVPIVRVSIPGSNIYGGVRQIMEFIPAMAILAGVGAKNVFKKTAAVAAPLLGPFESQTVRSATRLRFLNIIKEKANFSVIMSLVIFIPHIFRMVDIHPNQTVYFNSLMGGLSGAKEKEIPAWGNSFGAAYRQGVEWINDNAQEGANVVYAHELIPNIPRNQLRRDLVLWNVNRSGYLANGEYAITLTYDGTKERSYYDAYLERFVRPSFTVDVDGVSILKVWHNTNENQKYNIEERVAEDVNWEETEQGVRFDVGREVSLSRMKYTFSEEGCNEVTSAFVQISKDENEWIRLPGVFPSDWLIPDPEIGKQPSDGKFIEPFVGQNARYIDFSIQSNDACMRNVESSKVYYFVDPPYEITAY